MRGILPALLIAAALAPGVAAPAGPAVAAEAQPASHEKVTLPVRGMTCGACSGIIREELKKLHGVVAVDADYEKGTATVTFVKGEVTVEHIVAAINKTGFKASMPPAASDPPR